MKVNAEALAKICKTCSGHAMKIEIIHASPQEISDLLSSQNCEHRVEDSRSDAVFDDKMATVVTGVENLSHVEFTSFIAQMDSLRFRNILIFPTKQWCKADGNHVSFWDRMGPTLRAKFSHRVTQIDLEGF
jgi:hypothetical protein